MRKPVLLKVPGVYKARLGPLMDFINSEENLTLEADNKTRSKNPYVTLLNVDIADGEQDSDSPRYNLSMKIATEFCYERRGGRILPAGMADDSTPRAVMHKVFDLLGIFPVET